MNAERKEVIKRFLEQRFTLDNNFVNEAGLSQLINMFKSKTEDSESEDVALEQSEDEALDLSSNESGDENLGELGDESPDESGDESLGEG
ncbi:hypothetical protein [Peribacillus loiseleuriae]|uniref:Uncharacterized protein n=1 Tax=Peribacillus loiseleuriae TaxID=1679170 RepID=A0A0K9GVX1_9BACI|nr:hypothetical protein [Peribacillus loiseleuriae]KMY50397.1 hypothetical protein AC625_13540 [Peribacillus loiseleuriae]